MTFIEVLGSGQHHTAPTWHSRNSCPSFLVRFSQSTATPFPGLIWELRSRLALPFGNTPLVADCRLASTDSLLPWLLSVAPPARGWQKWGGHCIVGCLLSERDHPLSAFFFFSLFFQKKAFLEHSKFLEQIFITPSVIAKYFSAEKKSV